jgi:hypothetical protein
VIIENVLHGKAKIITLVAVKPRVVVGIEVTGDHSAIRVFIIDFSQKVTKFG